ncbi:MAG: hypothetical protein HY353_02835 [Candidatus Omnitrophica bacterium]|nr:hypothetical protein [Candidatus Omnitrophota bacterium]
MQRLVIASLIVAFAQPAAAAEPKARLCPICAKANDDQATYGEKAGNTLARGALNLGLGWTEMIRQPGKAAREGKNVFHGIANGIGFSARRTLRGLGELLTFWTPKVEGEYIHFSKDCPIDTMQ